MIKLKPLLERVIGKVHDSIQVVVVIDQTVHGAERQDRHDTHHISETQILSTCDKALKKITALLLNNKIDIGGYIHIYNMATKLNVIGVIKSAGGPTSTEFQLVVITVMTKEGFKAKPGTFTINV
jgi:hypothetical protein